ncbi:MAG: FHA domain-containing protein [Minicystis sp.]
MPAQLYDTYSGATYALDPGKRFIIGRSVTCDLRLAADGVQRTHTHLEAEPAERGVVWYVCDRGTVCGTFLNGKQVDREALRTGDVIGLADRARFVFTTADPPPPPPPAPEPPPPLDPQLGAPIEALREIAADILARCGLDTPSSHRAAPLGTEARAAVLRAARGAKEPVASEAQAAVTALDNADRGDLAGAFAALLDAVDRDRPPSALFTRAAHFLIAIAPDRAGPILHRRAFTALAHGADAAPDAALLAESAQHAAMFVLRNEAGVLRDKGHPGARAVLSALATTTVSPWLHAFCAKAPPPEPADVTAEVAAVVAALRATPVDDVEERAALRRRLDDLLGHNHAQDR